MGHTANAMVNAKHPDAKAIASKQQLLSQQMRTLQKLATARQQRLMESMYRHEYFLESAELEQWIREQSQIAASEDYGQDYEHLQVIIIIYLTKLLSVLVGILNTFPFVCVFFLRFYKTSLMSLSAVLRLAQNALINVKS